MYHKKRTAHRYSVTSLWLNHLSSASSTSLCSGFRNIVGLDPFCSNALIILVLFFQIIWIVEFTTPNSRYMSAFFLSFSVCHITLTFPSTLKSFLVFVTVAMLSLYQSPVNCRNRNAEGNFTQKVNYRYGCHFSGLEFM